MFFNLNIYKFLILFFCGILSFETSGMESQDLENNFPGKLHFQEDASIIENYLASVQEAELHFFWTTGRDPVAMKHEYGANLQVSVGGAQYGRMFFVFLEELLAHSPSHLKIKFVCDAMTRNSNEKYIFGLEQTYKQRFEILDVFHVVENIIKNFPNYEYTINLIFQNATKGNPVIASDIYRLIGMVYGKNSIPINLDNSDYTYCDVDTFCYGMNSRSHESLVRALFENIGKINQKKSRLREQKLFEPDEDSCDI